MVCCTDTTPAIEFAGEVMLLNERNFFPTIDANPNKIFLVKFIVPW
jgi:hypothetical protein